MKRHHPIPRSGLSLSLSLPVLALAALAAAGGACHRTEAAPQVRPSDEAPAIRVTTAVAQAREVPLTLAATGTLVPDEQSQVTSLVAGRVTEVMVERGARVHAGDPMLRLRDVDFRTAASTAAAMVDQARARLGLEGTNGTGGRFDPQNAAEVRAARANLNLASDTLRRTQALAQSAATSDQDLQRARSQAAAAQEQYQSAVNNVRAAYYAYQQAQVQRGQAARNLTDSVVRAPFDGEVAERMANVGEYVTTQRAVVTLVRIDPLRIEIQIPQERIPDVRRDQPVQVHVDAYPNRTFAGTVRYISAAVRSDTRSLVAEAVVPNHDEALRPGLFATARIDLGQRRAVVGVPPRAVLSEAGNNRVFVVANGHVQERVVTIADRTAQEVLIEHGVAAGERVALDALDRLGDGAAVVQTPGQE